MLSDLNLLGDAIILLAGLVVGWFSGRWAFKAGERQIAAQHVIAERAKWREKIRWALDELVTKGDAVTAQRVAALLELGTNPIDPEDVDIVDLAKRIVYPRRQPSDVRELVERVTLLLKHDWDRAKHEAGMSDRPATRILHDHLGNRRDEGKRLGQRFWSGQQPVRRR